MTLATFTQTILPFKDQLYRVALRRLHRRAEAEDVVQEVLLKLWQRREELHGVRNLEAWMTRMTTNKATDRLRRKERQNTDLESVHEPAEHAASPYQRAATNDALARIRSLMDRLPPVQRQVLELRDVDGMAYREIAAALGISLEQVKVYLHRARKKMQQHLIEAGLRSA